MIYNACPVLLVAKLRNIRDCGFVSGLRLCVAMCIETTPILEDNSSFRYSYDLFEQFGSLLY